MANIYNLIRLSLRNNLHRSIATNVKSNTETVSKVDRILSVEDLASLFNTKTSTVIDILDKINVKTPNDCVSLKVAERVAVEIVRSSYTRSSTIKPCLKSRPPIVTVMGHVDHGKTTLLDTLRNTSVATGEAGGITQHIGAFSVPMATGRMITFLDTPGHAVFSSMRSRGVTVTDVIVLVIAANDGVMPQTVECIEMALEAQVPLVAAINKCDKFAHNVTNVKHQLLEYGVQLEEFGGDVQCVEISALKGSGLDTLEEAVLVQADLKEVTADPTRPVQGAILETKTAKGLGSVATVLVTDGTLQKGCALVCGSVWSHVRAMYNDKGILVKEATPSSPVLTAGWSQLPQVGDECFGVKDRTHAQRVLQLYNTLYKRYEELEEREKIQQKLEAERPKEPKPSFKTEWWKRRRTGIPKKEKKSTADQPLLASLVIKSDVAGSLEALEELLYSCQPKQIKVDIALSGVGNISEEDINTAQAFGGVILAFNLPANKTIAKLAAEKGVVILSHNVIYKLLDQLKEWLQGKLPTVIKEEIIGEANVLKVFHLRGANAKTVGGCRVKKGRLNKDALYQLWRNNEMIFEGKLIGMKREKEDVQSALKETECGLTFNTDPGWQEGDTVICLEKKSVLQDIDWELGF